MRDQRASGGTLEERAVHTCNHCEAIVVMNPHRQRERAWCSGCDHYICDACAAAKGKSLKCRPMAKVVDELFENAARGITLPEGFQRG